MLKNRDTSTTDDFKMADDGTVLHAPKNQIVNISEIWAFLSVDKNDNTEGVIARGGVPLIAADAARLMSLEPHVKKMVQQFGVTVRLVKFTKREEIRTYEKKK